MHLVASITLLRESLSGIFTCISTVPNSSCYGTPKKKKIAANPGIILLSRVITNKFLPFHIS